MAFDLEQWTRLEHDGVPLYLRADGPDWFVPNRAGERTLQTLASGDEAQLQWRDRRFLARLPDGAPPPPPDPVLPRLPLHELWLHLTDKCNLGCSHCLFSCSGLSDAELSAQRALDLARQASTLGCRVFALTGGEPTIHPDFSTIVSSILSLHPAAHVAVLTNGTQIDDQWHEILRWPAERFHLQVSVDGIGDRHDRIRGQGAFEQLESMLPRLGREGVPFTVSMCPDAHTFEDMPRVVEFAAHVGATKVHFMWYLVRGRGKQTSFVPPGELFEKLVAATEVGERLGIGIDNIESLRTQVFAPTGTRHLAGTSGVSTATIAPDGQLYPSPALVGVPELGTPLGEDDECLSKAWNEGSEPLRRLRRVTAGEVDSPWRNILGGGDPDHSLLAGGEPGGCDPYFSLHEMTAAWLATRQARRWSDDGPPRLRSKMGDVLESCSAEDGVALVHTNCLLSLASDDARSTVKLYYADAAVNPREDIRNPVCYPDEEVSHIPSAYRIRSYGCGSPVLDAELSIGEDVLDLGSGSGVECFMAARRVGARGRVVGVDMLDPMLALAREGAEHVRATLGFDNLRFEKGYLESLPLESESVDVALSNCVINLSPDKRTTFTEIARVLRPGGRLVVSDVVCESEPDPSIRNDDQLKGECIAGALTQRDLFGLLDETGFTNVRALKRFPYRVVNGHPFFSLTFSAVKPAPDEARGRVMYTGPLPAVIAADGTTLWAGQPIEIDLSEIDDDDESILVLDEEGFVTNVDIEPPSCCAPECSEPPAESDQSPASCCAPECAEPQPETSCCCAPAGLQPLEEKHEVGCMICGAPLLYGDDLGPKDCGFCGRTVAMVGATCEVGHFVCDNCHQEDALTLLRHVLVETKETDMYALLRNVRRHEAIAVHGPEHHALVPGIIVATYRNLGGEADDAMILEAIERGSKIAGGFCGIAGTCGAAFGVGIAFSLILGANPLHAGKRQTVIDAVARSLTSLSQCRAARCCQRDAYLSLREAAEISRTALPVALRAEAEFTCEQVELNKECIHKKCPIYPRAGGGDE